jgi:peptide/nickel transport system substrate-binding protein
VKILRLGCLLIGLALLLPPVAAGAHTFRWAAEADAASFDPYTRDETFQLALLGNVYEPLVRHTPSLGIEPALAVSWERTDPTTWRFHLRPGVKWQDGTPFTAADVLFSLHRAQSPNSLLRSVVARIREAVAVDDLTVDLHTTGPDAILPQELANWYIMSKAWSERVGATEPALLAQKQENFATRHAMGTGPFRLVLREPDRRTVFERNPLWWDAPQKLVDRAEFLVLGNATTRMAALTSGEVDLVTGVPPQDADFIARSPGLRLLARPELRTIFLGMDQWRDELLKSDIKGRNPLRDRRVREAIALAIDEGAIAAKVMRGRARPTWLLWAPDVTGYDPALDHRPAPDPARARTLLAEAGYPGGFTLGMDCPNDRYVMDEAICTAVVSMLARVGIRVQLTTEPKARFFAEIGPPGFRASFYLLGWTPLTGDALNALWNLVASRGDGRGLINFGGYSNKVLDALIDDIATAANTSERQALIDKAATLIQQDVAYIPLHQQVLLWGAKAGLDLTQPPDGAVMLRLVHPN